MKQTSLRTLLRRAAALTLSVVLSLPMTARATPPTPLLTSTQTYLDGVSYVHTVGDTAAGRIESYAVELPRTSRVEPILLQSSGTVYGGATIDKAIKLAEDQGLNVFAAINTDYFSTSTGIPLGIVIEGGVYKSDAADAPAMVIDSYGEVSLCPKPEVSLSLVNRTTGETVTPKTVNLTQTGNFEKNADLKDIGGLALSNFNSKTSVTIGWANDAITVNGTAATLATSTPASTACTAKLADGTTCTGTVTNGTCSNAANHAA